MSEPKALSAGSNPDSLDAMLAFLGDRDPLEVFAEMPDALRSAVKNVPADRLCTPEVPGKWSVLNVVQHLGQTEVALGFRYRKVLAEPSPALPAMDQDLWVTHLFPDEVSLEEALKDFAALRAINMRLLRRVQGDQWERHGIHSQRGKETLSAMVRLYAAHDRYHLFQIERIAKAVGS